MINKVSLVVQGLLHFYSKYDFSSLPPEDDEDYIDMGGAILTFYSSLVDLLGRCAPEAEAIKSGRSDSIRARAILRSLVSMEDLEGVLGLRFILPVNQPPPSSEDGKISITCKAVNNGVVYKNIETWKLLSHIYPVNYLRSYRVI